MALDVSFTAYKAREKERPKMGEYRKPDKAKMHEAYVKWKLKRAKKKFDLKKFLGGKLKSDKDGEKEESQHGAEG